MKIRKAVIPAAGHGTRFLPVTKAMPKEMLAVIDAPAIQYVAKEAADSGVEEILIVINRSKELIRRYFEPDAATCSASPIRTRRRARRMRSCSRESSRERSRSR